MARWPGVLVRAFFCALFVSHVSHAAPPVVDALFPVGGAQGSSNEITLSGKFTPWPPKVWVSGPGVSFEAKTNSGKFISRIDSSAVPGARLVRFYNEEGSSELRFFVVGAGEELMESEPNNHFAKPQLLTNLPITLNARLDKRDDVDSFAISMRAGQFLVVSAEAYVLMTKADLVLRLLDTNGVQLAWNHDYITLDPRLVWHATNDCTVVLQCFGFAYPADAEIRFAGGDGTSYRLHVATTNSAPSLARDWKTTDAGGEPVELPAVVRGQIDESNEEDRVHFTAGKNETIEVKVTAASFGSPLDASLRIENPRGQVVARNDDFDGSPDPRVEWKTGTNGNFVAIVSSTTHRGGPEFCYELSLRQVAPDFAVTFAANSLAVTAGSTNELKLNVKRLRGHTNALTGTLHDLPKGVSVVTNMLGKDNAAALKLLVASDAPPFSGPVRLTIQDTEGIERQAVFELTSRGEDNGVPNGYSTLLIPSTENLWFTVRPPKKDSK